MQLDRTEIPIKLVGGPCDGETGPPTYHDEIEVVRFPNPSITLRIESDPPPKDEPYRHRYRRNMQRPWEFDHRP